LLNFWVAKNKPLFYTRQADVTGKIL